MNSCPSAFLLLLVSEEVGPEVPLGEGGQRVVRGAGFQQVAGQHRVEGHALEQGAGSQHDPLQRLRVVRPFLDRRIGEAFADRPGALERCVRGLGPTRRHGQADQYVGLLLDHDAHGTIPEEGRELLRLHLSQVEFGHVDLGLRLFRQFHQPVEQAPELERGEQSPDLLDVPLPHHRILGFHIEGQIGHDPGEVLVEGESLTGRLDVLFQLPLQLVRSCQQLLHGSELLNELGRGLVPDAGHARDVVRRVTLERDELQVLRRRQAEPVLDRGLVEQDDVGDPAAVEQDPHARSDQLEEVSVGCDDRRVDPLLGRPQREGADGVVGLVIGHQEHGDPKGSHDLLDQPQLRLEVLGRLPPPGLVLRIHREPGHRLPDVECHRDQVRALLRQQLDQHRGEAVDGVGDLAGRGGQSAGQGEEGAIREGMPVKDEESAGRIGRVGPWGRHGAYRSRALRPASRGVMWSSSPATGARPRWFVTERLT